MGAAVPLIIGPLLGAGAGAGIGSIYGRPGRGALMGSLAGLGGGAGLSALSGGTGGLSGLLSTLGKTVTPAFMPAGTGTDAGDVKDILGPLIASLGQGFGQGLMQREQMGQIPDQQQSDLAALNLALMMLLGGRR